MGDMDIERLLREQAIMDKGYEAVRKMAAEMVKNGAEVSDILFHANQVWHEFKTGAVLAGLTGVAYTGMYMNQYDHAATEKIIKADQRYASGLDSVRVQVLTEVVKQQAEKEKPKAKAAKAGK